jgi:hypothetical protein
MDGDVTRGEIEAVTVAKVIGDRLLPAGEVQFGVGRRLREVLEMIRREPRPRCAHRGDGFLATFDGPARAVRCASAIAETVGSLRPVA